MKLLHLGQISLDGSKVRAHASTHRALSHGHLEKREAHLRKEVKALLAKAEVTDGEERPDGLDLPAELTRREARLGAPAATKAEIETRAKARFEAEQQAHEAKMARREAQRQAGKMPRGKEPQPPEAGPREKDQVNQADDESLGRVDRAVMDNGYFSAAHVHASLDREIEPLMALGREAHHLPLAERFCPYAPEPVTDDPVVRMAWRLKTKAGRTLYA